MKKFYELLVKVSDGIFLVEKWLLLVSVVVVVGVNFVNVCLRYLAGGGLSYCEMLSICLFMFMVIIGANIAVKTDNEIKIELFRFHSEKADAAFRLLADVVSIAAIIFCIFGLVDTVESVMQNLQKVTPLPIYTYHIYIIMTIGFAMVLLDHIIIFVKHILILMGQKVEGGAKTL